MFKAENSSKAMFLSNLETKATRSNRRSQTKHLMIQTNYQTTNQENQNHQLSPPFGLFQNSDLFGPTGGRLAEESSHIRGAGLAAAHNDCHFATCSSATGLLFWEPLNTLFFMSMPRYWLEWLWKFALAHIGHSLSPSPKKRAHMLVFLVRLLGISFSRSCLCFWHFRWCLHVEFAAVHTPKNQCYVSVEVSFSVTGLSTILQTTKLDRIISEIKSCHHEIFSRIQS